MKKILAVTGIRSEVEYLLPILVNLINDGFDVSIAVSGAHLSKWHNNSLEQIKSYGIKIVDMIDSLLATDRRTQRSKGVGLLLTGLSQTVERENPDILIVVGDREESIATAIVGNYMNVLVAHIGGGDPVYGNSDDPIRHAVSSMANIHFTLCDNYAENLLRMGEESFRVFNVGSPSLDGIKKLSSISMEEINDKLQIELESKKYIMLLKHPLSSEVDFSYKQMKTTLLAVESFCKKNDLKCIGIYPNTDPGSSSMIEAIDEFVDSDYISYFRNLERLIFVNLLRNSLCLIGNSSMGILEAPFLTLPVVNVGNRQKGRHNAGNVIFVDYINSDIENALEKSCFDDNYRMRLEQNRFFYGDGESCGKISSIIRDLDISDVKWYVKKLNYLDNKE